MTATLAHTPTPPSLVSLLTQQRDLYRELKLLSDQQAALIAEGLTDQLLSLLARRQGLVQSLTELNRDLVPVRQANAAIPAPQQAQVRVLMDEVDGLLQQIIEQDDRDRSSLQRAQRQVGTQIQQARHGGVALNAYRPTGTVSAVARFTDRKG